MEVKKVIKNLSPAAEDLDDRIIYIEGDYIAASIQYIEANNLISFLKLDDPILAINRKRYIKRKTEEMDAWGQDAQAFFEQLWEAYPAGISFLRYKGRIQG